MFKIITTTVAVAALTLAIPAAAFARTDAENQQCRAVGQTMQTMGKTQKEIVTLLRDSMENPSAEDKETLAQLDELAAQTGAVGDALLQIYGAAQTPTQAQLDKLNETPLDQLIDEAEKCV